MFFGWVREKLGGRIFEFLDSIFEVIESWDGVVFVLMDEVEYFLFMYEVPS